jgi:hypothetical protein
MSNLKGYGFVPSTSFRNSQFRATEKKLHLKMTRNRPVKNKHREYMCLWWALDFRCPVKGRQHVYSGVVILTSCPYGDTAGSTLDSSAMMASPRPLRSRVTGPW